MGVGTSSTWQVSGTGMSGEIRIAELDRRLEVVSHGPCNRVARVILLPKMA
jgi:hypothetical protein